MCFLLIMNSYFIIFLNQFLLNNDCIINKIFNISTKNQNKKKSRYLLGLKNYEAILFFQNKMFKINLYFILKFFTKKIFCELFKFLS